VKFYNKDKIYIVDGSGFLYRSYYAIRSLVNSKGKMVNAVYGFCRTIKSLIDKYDIKYIIVVWDSKGETFRHQIYSQYKSSRDHAPIELFEQKDLIMEFLDIIKLRQIYVNGIEADDLIYSLAKKFDNDNEDIVIVSSDKDMFQILSLNVNIYDPFKDELITKGQAEEKFGFKIDKLPFYYALIGDNSDNIPGVKGIGPKTANKLVIQFQSLDDLYNNIDLVESLKTKELLLSFKDDAYISEKLFQLKYYDLYMQKDSCKFDKTNWNLAKDFFEELEFKTLLKTIDIKIYNQKKNIDDIIEDIKLEDKYELILVNNVELLNEVILDILKYKLFALDVETTGLKPIDSKIVGLSIAIKESKAYYIPFGHITDELQLKKEEVLSYLKDILEDNNIKKVLHNAKFDKLALFYEGINLNGIIFDTMIAARLVLYEDYSVSLKYLSKHYFKETMFSWDDIVKKNGYKDFSQVPLSIACIYAALDAHQTLKLYNMLKDQSEFNDIKNIYYNIEMPLIDVLTDIEINGIFLDTNLLYEKSILVQKEIDSLKYEITNLIDPIYKDINLNSFKQLEDLLFNYLKLPKIRKTEGKSGYSTDSRVLKELSKIDPIANLIMKYRELFKLKSSYLDTLSNFVSLKDNRIHSIFSQISAATGRLASYEPNLQNVPLNGFHIRECFKPENGNIFVSADYSQIELRVIAYLSQDKKLIEAFLNNEDIHKITASNIFDINIEYITDEQRQIGKKINFSILYGLSPFSLSKDLDISLSLAKEYIEKYMSQFPSIYLWMDKVIDETIKHGYVKTLFGRKRYIPQIKNKNKHIFQMAKRMAINTVGQGTAAEIMKLGMISVYNEIKRLNLKSKLIVQIHDELLLEVVKDELDVITDILKSKMENIVNWNIPLVVTILKGENWNNLH